MMPSADPVRHIALCVLAAPFYDLILHAETLAEGMTADLLPPDLQLVWSAADAQVRETGSHADTTIIRTTVPSWPPTLDEELATAHAFTRGNPVAFVTELRKAKAARKAADLRAQAKVAFARDEFDKAQALLEAAARKLDTEADSGKVVQLRKPPTIEWVGTGKIFESLPPTKWIARGLMIGPGRPTMFVAYGSTAKSLAAQGMALAVASGKHVWGYFECERGVVLHVDYEQGFHATAKRYQRLALGHGIDTPEIGDRLRLSTLPRTFLNSAFAIDAYSRAADGIDLVIVDSLRAAAPGCDENDSAVREFVDVLTHVSEATGAACVLIHHAGKPKDGHSDARTIARGSSGIYDACGCVLNLVAGRTGADPKRVTQVKTPAEAEGAPIDDFELTIEDVAIGDDRTAGVKVCWRAVQAADDDSAEQDAEKWRIDSTRILAAVRTNPGAVQDTIVAKARMQKARAVQVLKALVAEGTIKTSKGDNNSHAYWLVTP